MGLPDGEKNRMIDVQWDRTKNAEYDAHVTIVANDRKGLFSDLSRVCESNDESVSRAETRAYFS